ncbi:hypothetical protein CYCD_11650 [Tenuifilaceae bacterium CYCD]|nr:hypothetical protein CYCD_11650 [Tenuifilaceae bacterium CYCD]
MNSSKYILLIICLLLTYACSNIENTKNGRLRNESENKTFDKHLLNGIWAESEDENANFYIKNDSMYFIEDPKPCFIELSNDTLITHYEGLSTFDKIIKLDKDSLVLLNEVGDFIKLKRRK